MPPSPTPSAPIRDGRPSPTVSVVIPARNEAAGLPLVLRALPAVDEVIVVDGGSADDTVAAVRATRPGVHVLRQTRSGKGNALACGFAASRGDIVVTLDGDGSADPGEIPGLVEALVAGADVAHGSRYRPGGSDLTGGRLDRIGATILGGLVSAFFGVRITDPAWGYNAYRRSVLPKLDLPGPDVPGLKRGRLAWGDGPEIDPLVNVRTAARGLRVVEVAGVGYPRVHGGQRRDLFRRALLALRTLITEYLRHRRSAGRAAGGTGRSSAQPLPPSAPEPVRRARSSVPAPSRQAPVGERSTGRHAASAAAVPGPRRGPLPSGLPPTGPPAPAPAGPPSWPAASSGAPWGPQPTSPAPAAGSTAPAPWGPQPTSPAASSAGSPASASWGPPPASLADGPAGAPTGLPAGNTPGAGAANPWALPSGNPSGLPAGASPEWPATAPRSGHDGERSPADRRRGYPGPRPAWAVRQPGAHRTADVNEYTGGRSGRVYDTGVHHLPDDDPRQHVRRSGLYDTGVHRVGVYDSGTHRTDVYDTGAHHLPDEDGPLYRQSAPREVGGGRRRLDARDRRSDGRPDLTVIPGAGSEPDGTDGDRPRGNGGRPGHLRAVPGERYPR
jgi:hypothetical protein